MSGRAIPATGRRPAMSAHTAIASRSIDANMTRLAVARAVSIVGHPVVVLPVAALVAASKRGASLQQLHLIGGALVTLGVVVLGFSWWHVRAGRWTHVDASVGNERNSLNAFLGALCLVSAALLGIL